MNKLAIIVAILIIIIALYFVFKMPSRWVQNVLVELKITPISATDPTVKTLKDLPGKYINLAELEVLDSTGKNIALGAAVTGSSTYSAKNYPFSNLTDGKLNNMVHTAETKLGEVEYFNVELPVPASAAEIGKTIVIHNRKDYQNRIIGAHVAAYDNYGDILKEWTIDAALLKYTFEL